MKRIDAKTAKLRVHHQANDKKYQRNEMKDFKRDKIVRKRQQ